VAWSHDVSGDVQKLMRTMALWCRVAATGMGV